MRAPFRRFKRCIEASRALYNLAQTNRFEAEKRRDDEIREMRETMNKLQQSGHQLLATRAEQHLADLERAAHVDRGRVPSSRRGVALARQRVLPQRRSRRGGNGMEGSNRASTRSSARPTTTSRSSTCRPAVRGSRGWNQGRRKVGFSREPAAQTGSQGGPPEVVTRGWRSAVRAIMNGDPWRMAGHDAPDQDGRCCCSGMDARARARVAARARRYSQDASTSPLRMLPALVSLARKWNWPVRSS